jgi:hypothetical protein
MERPRAPSFAPWIKEMLREEFKAQRARMAELSIPELIEELASDSLTTRFLAEMCLRDATNT